MGSQESDIILIFVSSALITTFLAGLVVVFVVIYQKRTVAQKLQMQKREIDFKQELLQATIEGQERERKRLAKDLHDDIGSLLTGLKLNLRHQLKQQKTDDEQREFLNEACQMIDKGMANVRNVSHNMLPVALEDFGLVVALKDCIAPIQKGAIQVDLNVIGAEKRMPFATELGLLRVLQELLQNTINHAQASKAKIRLIFEPKSIKISYEDNGMGFSADLKPGLGIKNIYSRIQALSGQIELNVQPSDGFSASITVPLTPSS